VGLAVELLRLVLAGLLELSLLLTLVLLVRRGCGRGRAQLVALVHGPACCPQLSCLGLAAGDCLCSARLASVCR